MPQLDTLTYISSLFWIILTYAVYYILYVKEVLPNISMTLKVRNMKSGLMEKKFIKDRCKEELYGVRYGYIYKIYRSIWY